jgi:hypothetical protein
LRSDREDDASLCTRRHTEVEMHANVGDRIVIKAHHLAEPDRDCEILEVRGADGGPPYRVRWDADGHESLFFPGSDARVQHLGSPEG